MASMHHSPPRDMRRHAQRRVHGRRLEDMSQDFDATRLLHELRVHQIELESQNEELQEARLQAQAALDNYTELYDFAPVGYFSLDREGLVHQLNLAGATLLGVERSRLVGRRFGQFVEAKDRTGFNAFVNRVLDERTQDSCELELLNPRDPQERLFVQMEAASDRAGKCLKVAVVDITEKKRATEELVRSNLELQQFAYVAAHDLQTPLRSIHGFAQLLQQELQDRHSDQLDNWIGQVLYQVRRMHNLIQDLLSYSQVESRGHSFAPVDLNQVADEVLAISQAVLAEQGALVTRDELPIVIGDRLQLAQLLQNLIDNGIKYHDRPDGEPRRVCISASRRPGEWLISVRDNGIGIATKHHQRIFDIFHRLHSQQAYPGTGIGLAVCRRIVHRHGGRIWVESEPGRGSVFHFTLPDSRQN